MSADGVALTHLAVVIFIVGALPLIWLGWILRWRWVRNFYFRVLHLAAIAFVAIQTVFGQVCPLTLWEDQLRGQSAAGGFIERWVSKLLYLDLPPWAFVLLHVGYAVAVAATWFALPPRRSTTEGLDR
jgi:hypothetical protein